MGYFDHSPGMSWQRCIGLGRPRLSMECEAFAIFSTGLFNKEELEVLPATAGDLEVLAGRREWTGVTASSFPECKIFRVCCKEHQEGAGARLKVGQ